jgi:hypothetical protein
MGPRIRRLREKNLALRKVIFTLLCTLSLVIAIIIKDPLLLTTYTLVAIETCITIYLKLINYWKNGPYKKYKEGQLYRKALREFNKQYTTYYNYIRYGYLDLLVCKCLQKGSIDLEFSSEFFIKKGEFMKNREIHKKAIEKIIVYLHSVYVLKSAIRYYANHMEMANKTLDMLQQKEKKYIFFFNSYYQMRVRYLRKLAISCEKIKYKLETEKLPEYESAIRQLELVPRPSLLDSALNIAGNMITAPVRHVINIIEGIEENDKKRILKGSAFLSFSFIGATIIGDAIDAFEGIEAMDTIDLKELPQIDQIAIDKYSIDITEVETEQDIVENPNTHHVDPHWVDGYYRADGTYVEEYWRDGDGDTSINTEVGWVQSNPNFKEKI